MSVDAQGCMKSGQVLTDRRYKWFEPEYWRFGDPASAEGQINYMRHASGQARSLHSLPHTALCLLHPKFDYNPQNDTTFRSVP